VDSSLELVIQHLPIEQSIAYGQDLYLGLCIWLQGYRQGVGDHQGFRNVEPGRPDGAPTGLPVPPM
jgi:hypothetical protein